MPTKKLFISYAHKDSPHVYPVADILTEHGFTVWIDTKNLEGGKLWRHEIAEAIMDCDVFLLFLSTQAIQSRDVLRELDLASDQQKIIIPLLLDEINIPPSLQYTLAGIQWIPLYENPKAGVERLFTALRTTQELDSLVISPRPEQDKSNKAEAGKRSVSIKGNVSGSIIVTGDNNTIEK